MRGWLKTPSLNAILTTSRWNKYVELYHFPRLITKSHLRKWSVLQVSSDVEAIFSLEYILLEGHCFDEVSGSPPRGLQFVLGTAANPAQFDTIVMANLGYFQLKVWSSPVHMLEWFLLTGSVPFAGESRSVAAPTPWRKIERNIRCFRPQQHGRKWQQHHSGSNRYAFRKFLS